jgi:hypothetical protein
MTYKNKQLLAVIDYSETMLKEAKAGNWENFASVETMRSNTLKKIFSLPFTETEKEKYNEKILKILNINKCLEAATIKARDEIRKQAGSINKGRHAVGMYAQNAG